MTENIENTISAYLGPQFQQRLMWQLLVEPEFAEKIIPDLAIEYFDDPNLKRLFIIILEYYKEFDKVPNLQNQSIHQAISKYKTPNNLIEEESLFAVIKRIELWNERIINKQMLYDGDVVQKSSNMFIKQQEYRKLAEMTLDKVKSGEIKNKFVVNAIEDRFQKISHIGETDDDSESLIEGVSKALRKEFRETIPTGIGVIDSLTGGGLGKGEIGVILTPSGVGKTTALTIIANTAYEQEKNVAQIIFEDTKDQIKRKHYTIWAKSALSKLNEDDENIRVTKIVNEKVKELEGKGRLIIKRFSQEDTTMKDIRNWMISYEKKWGFKFDMLVLDYLDCVESHKKSQDRNESELTVIKGFEALSSDFDIPAWTAIQTNRSGFGAEFVEAHQTGGSIKRIQKAHFFMSVAKTPAQQEANFANIRIIKARFAKDGQTFEDCVFNNDTMQIIIDDPRYVFTKTYKNLKHYDDKDVDKLEDKANKLSGTSAMHLVVSQHTEGALIDKLNSSDINSMLQDNKIPENDVGIQPNKDFHPEAEHHEKQIQVDNVMDIPKVTSQVDVNDVGKFELDDSEKIIDAPSDAVNDAPSDAVNDDLIEITGDTTTITETIEIIDEVLSEEEKKPIDLTQFKSPGVGIYGGTREDDMKTYENIHGHKLDEKPISEEKNENISLDDILSTDPDKPQGKYKTVHDMLVKKRNYQHVKKE